MNQTNIFKPVYEVNKDISRLLGEIDSLESLISSYPNYRNFLRDNWRKWREESVCNAFLLQRWSLEAAEISAYMNGKMLNNTTAAKVQMRIKNYAAVLDYFHTLNAVESPSFRDLSEIHRRLRVGVEGTDMFAGQLRTRFIAIYYANKKDVKFHLPNPRDLESLLGMLFEWTNSNDNGTHPYVRAAIVHHRLMELRPFQQDNGKVARLFFRQSLISDLYPWRALMPYESIFSRDRSQYYRLLDAYETPNKNYAERMGFLLEPWICYHLEGICRLLLSLLNDLSAYAPPANPLNQLNGRQKKALHYVNRHGSITNRIYRERFKVGRFMAYMDLKSLVEKKILVSSSKKGRSVVYHKPSI